jgi:Protein of unknown function (DUF3450)
MDYPQPRQFRRIWLIGLLLVPLHADTDPLEVGEKAASEWIKVRLETDRLENAWMSERPLLESTINGLKERADALEDKRDHVKAKTAKDREEIATMQEKNQAAGDDLHAAEERLQALSLKLNELRPVLPPRLSDALELSYRSLASPGLASGERMRLSMTMLGRIMQFNRTVTYGDEVLTVDGEQGARSLEVIYWGLSHGYALDRTAGKAWYGSPGPQGWQWESHPDAARPVAALMAIYNDKADPDFVEVPASLSHSAGEDARR